MQGELSLSRALFLSFSISVSAHVPGCLSLQLMVLSTELTIVTRLIGFYKIIGRIVFSSESFLPKLADVFQIG